MALAPGQPGHVTKDFKYFTTKSGLVWARTKFITPNIFFQECYSKGYKRHYVKKVYVAQSGRLGRMSVPLPNTEPPTAGATTNRFKTVQSVRFFRCKKVTYLWDEEGSMFYPLKGLDHNTDTGLYHQ